MILLSTLTLLLASVAQSDVKKTLVQVTISEVKPIGQVFGQVFADATSFKKREGAVMSFTIEPHAEGAVTTTVTLEPGRYAIALFQDIKGTGKLETNMLGKPTVPFGFSNNAGGRVGPPGFDDAVFEVGTTATQQAIQLK